MHPCEAVALAYRYPTPDALDHLKAAVETSLDGAARYQMDRFLREVSGLDLGRWEELHTMTLDLSPLFVPYVGHVKWGENYRRGEFMADLKRDMGRAGVDLQGELPDHIEPILRYLAATSEPLSDLVDVLPEAVKTMASTLKRANDHNSYRHVLAATRTVVEDISVATPVTIGGRP
jgi:nitrate reductase delta subunit